MQTKPFRINIDATGDALPPIDFSTPLYTESWLQDLIQLHPEILPAGEIEPIFTPLIPIGREIVVTTGSIDNLFISRQGYPVLVETKLWRNPQAKREVIAQVMDYGNAISTWDYSRLDKVAQDYSNKFEHKRTSLTDLIEQKTGPIDIDLSDFQDAVSNNLRFGRFLILIVGDRIRNEMKDMVGYVNKFPHLAMNIALIELHCYHLDQQNKWPLLVVPSVVAQTHIVERSIVEVKISAKIPYQVAVTQKIKDKSGRIPISEQDYWEKLKNKAPVNFEHAQDLISHFDKQEQTITEPKENSMAAYLVLPESGQRISLFFIRTDGVIECWPITIADQLGKAGLDQDLAAAYRDNLASCLAKRTKKLSIYNPAKDVDVDKMIAVVEQFIQAVLSAEPLEYG